MPAGQCPPATPVLASVPWGFAPTHSRVPRSGADPTGTENYRGDDGGKGTLTKNLPPKPDPFKGDWPWMASAPQR